MSAARCEPHNPAATAAALRHGAFASKETWFDLAEHLAERGIAALAPMGETIHTAWIDITAAAEKVDVPPLIIRGARDAGRICPCASIVLPRLSRRETPALDH